MMYVLNTTSAAIEIVCCIAWSVSGVTRVGYTRGGNWGCHPSIFPWKTWRPFFAHRCHYHYPFLLLSLGCHPLQGRVSPFLPVRPRFSTILCKFAHNFFLRVSPPWRVSPGAFRPPPHALVTPLRSVTNSAIKLFDWRQRKSHGATCSETAQTPTYSTFDIR